jgi:hypothetical protein
MSEDSRFSGSSGTPGGGNGAGQDYGFFTTAPAPAPTQFGGPPAQSAPPASPVPQQPALAQFGPPASPVPQQPAPAQFGPPASPVAAPGQFGPPPYPPVQRRGLPVWAIVAICVPAAFVVLGILAAIAIPVFLNQRSTPVMPNSISGVPRSTDPAMTQAVDEVKKQVLKQNPGHKVDTAGYGSLDAGYVVMGTNMRVNGASEFASLGLTSGQTSFGDDQCATNAANRASLCVHVGTRGSIEVLQFGTTELSTLAAQTDKVWSAQPFGS